MHAYMVGLALDLFGLAGPNPTKSKIRINSNFRDAILELIDIPEIIEIPEAELDRPFNENNEQLKYVPSLNLRNVLFLNDLRKIGDIKNQQVLFLIDYFSRCTDNT